MEKLGRRLTTDELVGALDALDVPFLMNGVASEVTLEISPTVLLQELAAAEQARVRSAIIPLLLRHPEFALDAKNAAATLQGRPRYTLELFYTAAALLQGKLLERLARVFGAQPRIPDLFSGELQIELSRDVEQALEQVGTRHAQLRGICLNWVGTYEHAALTFLKHVELQPARGENRLW